MIHPLKILIHTAGAFLFPHRCVGCDKEPTLLCQNCAYHLTASEQTVDQKIFALFHYRDRIIRDLIWHLKYRQVKEPARLLAPYFQDKILDLIADDLMFEAYLETNKILIIPVPMSKQRLRKKRWNQAQVLAEMITKNTDHLLFSPNLVIKTRPTKTQVSCRSKNERLTNVKDAFTVTDPNQIKDRICLIIDDVTTTGATLNEIIGLLERNGGRLVLGLAVAHN